LTAKRSSDLAGLADANGNLAGSSAIAWTLDRDTPDVPSPLLNDASCISSKATRESFP
jgi:hypothetical protein